MKWNQRYRWVAGLTALALALGGLRFFQICILKHEVYAKAAEQQRVYGVALDGERGNIFDRNMIPITNRTEETIVYEMPNASEYTIHTTKRYGADSIAKYVTGYLNGSGDGVTGVEAFFNEQLKTEGTRQIVMVRDAKNNPIQGFGYTITDAEAPNCHVKLTLDYYLQSACETVFSQNQLTGAFVMQDVETGDILAMGSYPTYEHEKIADYLESENGELTNRATSAYSLGSVYKMVVAACAIEEGLDLDYSYYCAGYEEVDGLPFRCHSYATGGHGVLSLRQGFAQSCNAYFIDLGLQLGMERLVHYGALFGFGAKTGLEAQGITESAGNLPDINGIVNNRAVANLSIGQGELLATPLQVTNAMTAIANGGVLLQPNIVECLLDSDGNVLEWVKKESATRILKASTADTVAGLLEEVTVSGTAAGAISAAGLSGIYGKTGSAETGHYDDAGNQIVHSWFSGYFSVGDAQYTLTVFLENGVTLGQSATKIFAEIVSATSTI